MPDFPSQKLIGYSFIAAGWIMRLIAGICLFVLATGIRNIPFSNENLFIYVGLIFGCGLGIIGKPFIQKGKQFTSTTGEDILKKDKRPPILYLRSFKDDAIMATAVTDGGASEEGVLSKALARFGPCVAVGIPGEKLPPVGMARLYYSDEEWESKVLQLMKAARLVVMRAGDSHGFWRELEMSVDNLDPRKVVILIPFWPVLEMSELISLKITDVAPQGAHRDFCEKANKILPKKLSGFRGKPFPGGTLTGIIWFGEDWETRIHCLSDAGPTIDLALCNVFSTVIDLQKAP